LTAIILDGGDHDDSISLAQELDPDSGTVFCRRYGSMHINRFLVYRWNPDDDSNPRIDT
jgi:hypothetical protein